MAKLSSETLASVRKGCRYLRMDPYAPKPDWLVSKTNAIREGSYARARPTASTTDIMKQVFENTLFSVPFKEIQLIAEDCKTDVGEPVLVTEENHQLFAGRYLVSSKVKLEAADLRDYIGEVIHLRFPAGCKIPDGSYCETCVKHLL